MKISGVIFDFDGTLVDTLEDLGDSMNQALSDLGLPAHPMSAYRYFVGQGIRNLVKNASSGADGETQAKVLVRMMEHYQENWHNKTKPYPGIPGVVAKLKAEGFKLAILSNKPDTFTQIMAKHFFPNEEFDIVRGETGDISRKPDPAGAVLIAEQFGVSCGEILYLGDTNTDMQTGLSAGMFTVGVTWGFRPVQELRQAGAQATIDRAVQIMDLVHGHSR